MIDSSVDVLMVTRLIENCYIIEVKGMLNKEKIR